MKTHKKSIYQFHSQPTISSYATKKTASTLDVSNISVTNSTLELRQMLFIKEKNDALICPSFGEELFDYNNLLLAPKLTYKNNFINIESLSLDD